MGDVDWDRDDHGNFRPRPGYTPRPRRANSWGQHPSYTPPPKGTTMPSPKKRQLSPAMRVRQLESELDSNLSLQQQLKQEEERLRADIRRADIPNPPPESAGNMFRVIVRFSDRGPGYTYLLARHEGHWYTTGVHADHKFFENWEKLCVWLNSTAWHSHVERLQVTGKTHWPTEYEEQAPF